MTATNGQQLQAAKPQPAIVTFRTTLDKMKSQIQAALPKHLDPDRMLRIVLTTVQRTPKLLECTRESLLGAIVQCAQLGLEPDGLLGQAYLIPFFNARQSRTECQLIVGYRGLVQLARRSGEISSVVARIVHQRDTFRYSYELERDILEHKPSGDPDPGPATHAYCIFRLKDGTAHFEVMTVAEINRIRDKSQGYLRDKERSPWSTHWEEMAKKTVLRRASKMAPASVEDRRLARAIALEDQAATGESQSFDDDAPVISVPVDDEPIADVESKPAAVEFVISTLKQRKEIVRLCKTAGVNEGDVCDWYRVDDIEKLSHGDAADAIERLTKLSAQQREPGGDDE